MAYPTDLDTLQTVDATDPRVLHADNHNSANRAIEALQAKLGIGASPAASAGPGYLLMRLDDGTTGYAALATAVEYTTALPRKATVTLSSADILALHTTPVQLVAAPGAGKVLVPMHAILSYTFGTVSYNETGSSPTWGFPSGSTYTNLGTIGASISNGQTSTQVVRPDSGFFCYPNEAIGMTVNAALTDGDYPVTITVHYSIEDVP